ncbi:hypothetical protein [Robertkochia sediminum]|uniref:hypothetical protein n=1 Tax=Robertkochia sediminum TaxID=2785326 RepID=UPI001932D15A|nr:hypothetical protein [Robertkochia sediminum]MBL7472926.1 hypothetical protein [Robertkochia sediminum]
MKFIPVYALLVFLLVSCSGNKVLSNYAIKPEVPLSALNARGIAAMSPNYKSSYYHLVPYLYYNEKGRFNEVQGDFYNLTFKDSTDINISVSYFRKYGKHRKVLKVLIALSETSSIPIADLPVEVTSRKHGDFLRSDRLWGNARINKEQERMLFVKPLEVHDKYDVLNQVRDDAIIVSIDGERYVFLNPELETDFEASNAKSEEE